MKEEVYQENKIKLTRANLNTLLAKIYTLNSKKDFCEHHEERFIDEEIDFTKHKFKEVLKDLYLLVLNYLEFKKSEELLSLYKSNLKHIFNFDFESISQINDDEDYETYYISKELDIINKFLMPFRAFDDKVNTGIGLNYLENILESTSSIIEVIGSKPEKESDVYNSVKHVIDATFDDYFDLTESFYKEAKHYVPDLLIPSLRCAVEYKYAKDSKRLVKTIEEILIDVQGYSNHHLYKIFYAVFYVQPGVCTEKRFNVIWKKYNFPENWNPILVIGK